MEVGQNTHTLTHGLVLGQISSLKAKMKAHVDHMNVAIPVAI